MSPYVQLGHSITDILVRLWIHYTFLDASQDPSVPVPYTIKDHKIGGRSIKVRGEEILCVSLSFERRFPCR